MSHSVWRHSGTAKANNGNRTRSACLGSRRVTITPYSRKLTRIITYLVEKSTFFHGNLFSVHFLIVSETFMR